MLKFIDVIHNVNLPFDYNVFSKKNPKLCRYSASFFGFSFDNTQHPLTYG